MKKIMLVDDNPDLIYMLDKMLKRLDDELEILSANSGEECFEILKQNTPDIILLDIMMPGMNGWDVLAKVRQNPLWENIPVVFLSAKNDDISQGLGALSCDGFIPKPFEIKDVKLKIDEVLEKRCK